MMRKTGAVFVRVFALVAAVAALPAWSFDWPAAGGTATIPAGDLVEVTGTDVTTAAACGEIVIEEGAVLSFTNITANATFAGKISGSGLIRAVNASGTKKRLTFTGDLADFTGGMEFKYVFATFNTGNSGLCPLKFTEKNEDKMSIIFSGAYTYLNPIDADGGANYGVVVESAATLGGKVTWRGGRLAGVSDSTSGYGGTVTGDVYCVNTSIYAQKGLKLLSAKLERSTSGGTVYTDGSPLDIKAKILKFTKLSTYKTAGVIRFLDENLVPDDCTIQFGTSSYASGGAIDLNGHDQRCKLLTHSSGTNYKCTWQNTSIDSKSGPATLTVLAQSAVTFPGRFDSHVSFKYASSTASTLTLTALTNKTDGAVRVTSGKLVFGPDATWSNLSELEVSGTGALTVNNGGINPGRVKVILSDDGILTLAAGVVVTADIAVVNGTYLDPGEYTADSLEMGGRLAGTGTLRVVNPEPKTEGSTFTWIGGSDDDVITSAANWKGGIAPEFDGTERLVFGEGTAQAVVSGVVSAYAVEIVTNSMFELKAADDESKLILGVGGLILTNMVDSTVARHRISCPIELYNLPQTWLIGANTTFSNAAPITSHATPYPLTMRCNGRPFFCADNSSLLSSLILTNITASRSQPYIYNMKGLGPKTRATTINGCPPLFWTSPEAAYTNETPLRIYSGVTGGSLSSGSFINSAGGNSSLYLMGKVTYYSSSSCETYFKGNVHFVGGVTHEKGKTITWRMETANEWIDGEGFNSTGGFYIDYGGTLNITAPSNSWSIIGPYKCTVKCHGTNVMARGGAMRMSSDNDAYRSSYSALDMNGYDQSISRIYAGWTLNSHPETYTTVKSETPAMLEIATDTVNNDILPLKVTGAAGIKFNAAGSLTFTNYTASTTGTLQVDRGTVRFAAGSGWVATTNIVLNGGTLVVAPGAGAQAFGSAQGKSAAWMTRTGGTVEIASGEEATVCALAEPMGNGHLRYLAPGVYGGAEAGFDAEHTLDWIAGGGTLRVLRSGDAGTVIMLK